MHDFLIIKGMRPATNLPLWKKLLFSVIFTTLMFSALEGGLRLIGFEFLPQRSSRERIWNRKGVRQDPDLPWSWTPEPGATCFLGGGPSIRFNELGFRGPLFEKKKKDGVFRIVCLGDSCTLGWEVEDNETFCFQLGNLLRARLEKRVETINGGVLGYTSAQGLHELRTRILELQPDLVIVSYNWNDHAPAISLRGMEYTNQSRPDNELPRTDTILRAAAGASQLRTYQFVEWTMASAAEKLISVDDQNDPEYEVSQIPEKLRVPLPYYVRNLAELVRIARDHRITTVMMTQPYLPPAKSEDAVKQFFVAKQEEYNAALLKVAQDTHAIALDVEPVFAVVRHQGQLFSSRVHPTARGHRMIAKALAEKILSLPALKE